MVRRNKNTCQRRDIVLVYLQTLTTDIKCIQCQEHLQLKAELPTYQVQHLLALIFAVPLLLILAGGQA